MVTEARPTIQINEPIKGISPSADLTPSSHLESVVSNPVPRGLDRALTGRAKQQLPWFSETVRRAEPGTSAKDKDLLPRLSEGLSLAATYQRTTDLAEREAISRSLLLNYGDPDYFIGQAHEVTEELERKRRKIARATASVTLVRLAHEQSKGKLTWLRDNPLPQDRHGRRVSNSQLVNRHTAGIIDVLRATEVDNTRKDAEKQSIQAGLSDWGERGDVLERDVAEVVKPDTVLAKVKSDSATWDENDMRSREREAHAFAQQLPKDLRPDFYQYAGLEPETIRQRLSRWAFTAGANATTTLIPLETAAVGAAIAGVTPMHELRTGLLWGAVLATEGAWLSRLNKAATESNNLLEKHDKGTKVWAKALYNWASLHKASRRGRRIAGWIGYGGGQIVAEVPWVLGAYAIHKAGLPLNETLTTFTGLNVGGAIGEEVNARLTKKANEIMSK